MFRKKIALPHESTPHKVAPQYHALCAEDALRKTQGVAGGLTQAQATIRLREDGPNILPMGKSASIPELLWNQINSPLVWVLIGSGAVAFVADPEEGIKNGAVILGVVFLNTLIGFVQEFRASRAIQALSQMVPETANVLRDNTLVSVSASDLVTGDIVQVSSGDKVPADLRLLSAKTLKVEEAALTGESVPSEKSIQAVASDASIGDRTSMAFGGTLVTYGTARGVVVATGSQTELGRINSMLSAAPDLQTPLTLSLKAIGKWITIAITMLAVLILAVGSSRMMAETGASLFDAIRETAIFAIALAVAAIPEGLPAIVTIALAVGVRRMASRRAIVRTLPSVETLGSTSVICSDKTGTLTKNEMTVTQLVTANLARFEVEGVGYSPEGAIKQTVYPFNDGASSPTSLIEAGALCNDSSMTFSNGTLAKKSGDPTELALIVIAHKANLDPGILEQNAPRIDALPFESENQFMATVHKRKERYQVILKGAPEVILEKCQMSLEQKQKALELVSDLASQGLRVLAFATKESIQKPESLSASTIVGDFGFLGLQAMIDPPRPEAIESIRQCHKAGIEVKMITGDHPQTAGAIGKKLGILSSTQKVATGAQLADMSDEDLESFARSTNVFARVAPEHKLRLVRALQAQGAVVAMTGDGVNDAPALKQANIGVAMGVTGTSVSKEASDIVLIDDNFSTIAAAVEEGRRVYDNLIKSLAFILPTNLGLALILVYAVLFFPFSNGELSVPILPTQILWINLVGAVALALPLAFEAKERNVMSRAPRKTNEPLMSRFVVFRTILVAVLMTVSSIALYEYELSNSLANGTDATLALKNAQTMAVTAVISLQLFYMLNCRSLKDSILRIGLFSNKAVFFGIAAIITLQTAFIYAPFMQSVFETAALSTRDVLLSIGAGASVTLVVSAEKLLRSWRTKRHSAAAKNAMPRNAPTC